MGDEVVNPAMPILRGRLESDLDCNHYKLLNCEGGGGGSSIEIDDTLSIEGAAADAKATGDALAGKQSTISDLAAIRTGARRGAAAYQKPASGIPATDLAASVQESIGKADTALQTAPVTSVNTKTGAVVLDASEIVNPSSPTQGASVASDIYALYQSKAAADDLRYVLDLSIMQGQLEDRAVQKVELSTAATTLVLPSLTSGRVSDFVLDVVNEYEVSDTPTAASFALSGTIGTDYNIVVPDGEDFSEMTSLAAGEMAEFYFTLTSFAIGGKPTWKVVKQKVAQYTLATVTP